jgi:ABC-type transport system substrate-binding protein
MTKKRFILYQKMDQIIIDEAPIIPLFYDKVARFTRRGNRFGINPLNLLSLKSKRIVLNHNNQIKKAVLFFVLFHVLTTMLKIVLNGTYLPTTINRFSITNHKVAPR